jgi:hypothetical protein
VVLFCFFLRAPLGELVYRGGESALLLILFFCSSLICLFWTLPTHFAMTAHSRNSSWINHHFVARTVCFTLVDHVDTYGWFWSSIFDVFVCLCMFRRNPLTIFAISPTGGLCMVGVILSLLLVV